MGVRIFQNLHTLGNDPRPPKLPIRISHFDAEPKASVTCNPLLAVILLVVGLQEGAGRLVVYWTWWWGVGCGGGSSGVWGGRSKHGVAWSSGHWRDQAYIASQPRLTTARATKPGTVHPSTTPLQPPPPTPHQNRPRTVCHRPSWISKRF